LKQLNIETEEVEELLIGLILEGKVEGRIDQVGMRLELDRKYVRRVSVIARKLINVYRQSLEKKRYAALNKWTEALELVHSTVVGKTATVGRSDPSILGPEGFGVREERWNL
jgi:COP9 signalosome complex subunit 2